MLILNQFHEILCQYYLSKLYLYLQKMKNSIQGKRFHEIDSFISRVILKFWPTVQVHKYVSCAHTSMFFSLIILSILKLSLQVQVQRLVFQNLGLGSSSVQVVLRGLKNVIIAKLCSKLCFLEISHCFHMFARVEFSVNDFSVCWNSTLQAYQSVASRKS